jgi:mono/diheme cytochrome c family protein
MIRWILGGWLLLAVGCTTNAEAPAFVDGAGTVPEGRRIYAEKCAACHGKTGKEGPYNQLVGPAGDTTTRAKTIGNYWPYATTVFDYIRRTMPYNEPGSLSDEEVYSLTAYLLHANGIIDSALVLQKDNLPAVQMPAQHKFVPDDRRGGPEIIARHAGMRL